MPMMGSWLPFSSKSRYTRTFGTMPKKFKYAELENATLNFHLSNRIGHRCYKGTISTKWGNDNQSRKKDVAIKNMTGVHAKNHYEWVRNLTILEDVDHPNLVKVLGYCAKGSKKKSKFEFGRYFLVNEFLRNGSVRDHLSEHTLHGPISWETRLRIARDSARALTYLHGKNIVHKMFRSSVVLLDDKFNVKVSDYLISRLGPIRERDNEFNLQDFSAHGPPLFMDQYGSRPETDIWSFGVFLCELITGKDPAHNIDNLVRRDGDYAKFIQQNFANEERVKAVMDPRLRGRYDLESAQELANIAKMCLRKEPDFRPTMKTVASMLTGIA